MDLSLDNGPSISDGVYYDYPDDESTGVGLAIDNGYNIGGSAEGAASLFSDDPIELASIMMDLDMPEASVGTNWSDTASISESDSAVPNTSFDNSPGSAYWLSVFGDADSVPGDISAQVASGNWSSLEAGMPIDSGIGTDSLGMDSSSLPGLGNLSNSAPIPGSLTSTSTLGELWDSVFDPYAYEASTASQVSQPNWINTTTTISRNVGIAALTLATGGLAGGAVDALGIEGGLGTAWSGLAAGAASSFTLSTLTQATQDGGLDLSLIDPGQTAYDTGFGTVTGGVLGTGFYGASVLGGDIADGLSSFSNNYGGLALAGGGVNVASSNLAGIGESTSPGLLGAVGGSFSTLFSLGSDTVGNGEGEWQTVNEAMSGRAAAYQTQITGQPVNQVYVIDGVKFDGVDATGLLEAKGPGYATFVNDGQFEPFFGGADDLISQAQRQLAAADGMPITWHVAEPEATTAIHNLFQSNSIQGITIVNTPAAP